MATTLVIGCVVGRGPNVREIICEPEMTKRFGERMRDRLERSVQDAQEVRQTWEQVVPVLEKSVSDRPDVVRVLEEVSRYLEHDANTLDAALGKMKEVDTIARTSEFEIKNTQTFLGALDQYLETEPETIQHVLEIVDLIRLKEAFGRLDDQRKQEIRTVIIGDVTA